MLDINLSASLSPNQNFTPINKLLESPYNKVPNKFAKLELDSYSDKSSYQIQNAYSVPARVAQGRIPRKNSSSGGGITNSYGGVNATMDETPKYIKDLRGQLNVALKQNLELRLRLDRLAEE
jgi:hypothetical protein